MVQPASKLDLKRDTWIRRTEQALGMSRPAVIQLLETEKRQSFRINRLKVSHPEIILKQLMGLGWQGQTHAWYPLGYTIENNKRQVSDSSLSQGGAIYVQNAASWLPVLALEPRPGEKILDMCAAPGGKASHILELTNNQAKLWVNDNSRARLAKMQQNFSRLGAQPSHTTLFDIRRLAEKLAGEQFDKILLDAPCSGEGMIDFNRPADLKTWSVAHIRCLQALQRRALLQAWQLLKPGGTLIYSTCTMAPEENEAVIDYGLRKLPAALLQPISIALPNQQPAILAWNHKTFDPNIANCLRLNPSPYIEAFFVAKLVKLD